MISKKYKIIYDITNCVMIYLLGLAFSMGAATVVKQDIKFPVLFAVLSAVILVGFVCVRKFVSKKPISLAIHIAVCVIAWMALPGLYDKVTVFAFAAILSIVDMNDFEKKKLDSFGEIHIATCLCFLLIYALTEYAATKDVDAYIPADLFSTLVCLFCVLFFSISLVRAYVSNAMKLVDNAHMDEDAPVSYMYGNSNKFIGPIIVLIVAIMLVVQSTKSANIIANAWFSLVRGVAYICNTLSPTEATINNKYAIADVGTSMYYTETGIAGVLVAIVLVLIIVVIYKVYKAHWRKDLSADETLESAAMVERREWIYHKESKKKAADTSVTRAVEIPVPGTEEAEEAEYEEKAEESEQ